MITSPENAAYIESRQVIGNSWVTIPRFQEKRRQAERAEQKGKFLSDWEKFKQEYAATLTNAGGFNAFQEKSEVKIIKIHAKVHSFIARARIYFDIIEAAHNSEGVDTLSQAGKNNPETVAFFNGEYQQMVALKDALSGYALAEKRAILYRRDQIIATFQKISSDVDIDALFDEEKTSVALTPEQRTFMAITYKDSKHKEKTVFEQSPSLPKRNQIPTAVAA